MPALDRESRNPSIKDIARAAGVSHSTVSRALQGSSQVSSSTAARIRKIAEDAGYRPSAAARSLVVGQVTPSESWSPTSPIRSWRAR